MNQLHVDTLFQSNSDLMSWVLCCSLSVLNVLSLFFQAWVANFERPRMNANSLLASPTGLSPYLRFGCLSCRLFYFKLTDLYRKVSLQWFQCSPLTVTGALQTFPDLTLKTSMASSVCYTGHVSVSDASFTRVKEKSPLAVYGLFLDGQVYMPKGYNCEWIYSLTHLQLVTSIIILWYWKKWQASLLLVGFVTLFF